MARQNKARSTHTTPPFSPICRRGEQTLSRKKKLPAANEADAGDGSFFFLVAGEDENINKQARKMRTNWVTNKQTADGFLRTAAVEGARTA